MTYRPNLLDKSMRSRSSGGESHENTVLSDGLIPQIEKHLEIWRQIARYLVLARSKKFEAQDEIQFLELKALIAQELEMVLASGRCVSPTREQVHEMINSVPSLRSLSELGEGTLHKLETQWHGIFIEWQATVGQLKVSQHRAQNASKRATLWEHLVDHLNHRG